MLKSLFDTGVLYDLFIETENSKIARELCKFPIYIANTAFVELISLIVKKDGTTMALQVAELINNFPTKFIIIDHDKQDTQKALEIMQKYSLNQPKKDFSMVDGIQLSLTQKHKFTLYTIDQRTALFDGGSVVKPY